MRILERLMPNSTTCSVVLGTSAENPPTRSLVSEAWSPDVNGIEAVAGELAIQTDGCRPIRQLY